MPYPDSFTPPNGNLGSERTKSFTKPAPDSNSTSAISLPISIFEVNTAAHKPYDSALAKEIASDSFFAEIIHATGPKSSSSNAGIPGFTFYKTIIG